MFEDQEEARSKRRKPASSRSYIDPMRCGRGLYPYVSTDTIELRCHVYRRRIYRALELFIQLVESQNGKGIEAGEEWLNDAQVLATKLFQHLVSMQCLSMGSTVETQDIARVHFIDHASVKVIARAALETYLVFFFIYGEPDQHGKINRELSKFRHNTWHLGGLVDRQRYVVNSEEGREALAVEERAIGLLRSEIEASPYLSTFGAKHRRQLSNGIWRAGLSWSGLGVKAGFHEDYFRNIYNYLCGYSHSSYASALQVRQAKSIDDQRWLIWIILQIGMVLMTHFSFIYPTVFTDANAILPNNSAARAIAAKWRFEHDDFRVIYDEANVPN